MFDLIRKYVMKHIIFQLIIKRVLLVLQDALTVNQRTFVWVASLACC